MDDGYVLVVGSAGIDVKGRPQEAVKWEAPNQGQVRTSVGGVARNIAENLAHLEVPIKLLTAIGDDFAGDQVLEVCEDAGLDCENVRQISEGRTGTYMALLKPDGQLHASVSDFEIMHHVDSDYLLEHETLFQDAQMVVIDASLDAAALETLFELTTRHKIRVVADPTTPVLASRLCPYISQMYMVVPNADETAALCSLVSPAGDRDTAIATARQLVSMGTKIAVVTLGEQGLAYAHGNGTGFLRAMQTKVVDVNGAGDAFSGAAVFGLLNDVPIDEAMRLGIAAASMTLASEFTVRDDLTQDMLYEALMV
jgi:pseudouridine kinase